ncbi:hypothetical protein STEG23_004156 [Scotinomys teguina]
MNEPPFCKMRGMNEPPFCKVRGMNEPPFCKMRGMNEPLFCKKKGSQDFKKITLLGNDQIVTMWNKSPMWTFFQEPNRCGGNGDTAMRHGMGPCKRTTLLSIIG